MYVFAFAGVQLAVFMLKANDTPLPVFLIYTVLVVLPPADNVPQLSTSEIN